MVILGAKLSGWWDTAPLLLLQVKTCGSLWPLIQGMKQEHEDGRLVTVTLPKALLSVSHSI